MTTRKAKAKKDATPAEPEVSGSNVFIGAREIQFGSLVIDVGPCKSQRYVRKADDSDDLVSQSSIIYPEYVHAMVCLDFDPREALPRKVDTDLRRIKVSLPYIDRLTIDGLDDCTIVKTMLPFVDMAIAEARESEASRLRELEARAEARRERRVFWRRWLPFLPRTA